jgi:ABC-type transporter Mla subunit MlaD
VVSADSVKFEPSPELRQSLEDLAASVQALMNRIASDPKIRADAIQVASGLVTTAQQVVTEQSGVLEHALKNAADKIASAQPPGSKPSRNPR